MVGALAAAKADRPDAGQPFAAGPWQPVVLAAFLPSLPSLPSCLAWVDASHPSSSFAVAWLGLACPFQASSSSPVDCRTCPPSAVVEASRQKAHIRLAASR